MSLIVAKKDNGKIYIVSDTKLTKMPIENYPEREISPPQSGVIKCTIISPNICISFAGQIEGVDEIIKQCRILGNEVIRILEILLQFHLYENGETDFVVCITSYPLHKIFVIKDLKKEEVDFCWIGNKDGFSEFQKYRHDILAANPNTDNQSVMEDALRSVIESNIVPDVKGFVISVSNSKGYFEYKSYISAYFPGRTLPSGNSVLSYGTAQDGGYNVYLFPPNSDNSAFAIHIKQGKFGIIYYRKLGGLLWPEIFTEVDEWEFSEITKRKYSIFPLGMTSSQQKSYFDRGEKALQLCKYDKALEYYNQGISVNETSLLANLNYKKGIVLFILNRHLEAVKCFNQAVKLNKSLQSHVLNFIQSQKNRKA